MKSYFGDIDTGIRKDCTRLYSQKPKKKKKIIIFKSFPEFFDLWDALTDIGQPSPLDVVI